MDSRSAAISRIGDDWSVTLDGRYVVRFYGENARELATRQLYELAELLGFEVVQRGAAPAERNDGPAVRTEGGPRIQRR